MSVVLIFYLITPDALNLLASDYNWLEWYEILPVVSKSYSVFLITLIICCNHFSGYPYLYVQVITKKCQH